MIMGNVNEGRNELGQFVQGRQETAEEKIKKNKSSSRSLEVQSRLYRRYKRRMS